MFALIIAILCSVSVGILLKVARHRGIAVDQSIAVNYIVATSLCYGLLNPDFNGQSFVDIIVNHHSSYLFILLALLLPSIFVIQAKSLEFAGIIRTDAAQRLSLFLPILAAFTFLGEAFNAHKFIALLIAFMALCCLFWRTNEKIDRLQRTRALISLVLVWLGFGVIDILFKQIAKSGSAFPLTLFISFVGAGCLMFAYLLFKRTQWHIYSVLVGLLLGVLNFGNILFYIKAHQALKDTPTLVFTGMNLGVICLGTLCGLLFFKEKVSRLNLMGIVLAIIAIVLLFNWR